MCKYLEENQMVEKTNNRNKGDQMTKKQREDTLCHISATVTLLEEYKISKIWMFTLTVLTVLNSLMIIIQTLLLLSK